MGGWAILRIVRLAALSSASPGYHPSTFGIVTVPFRFATPDQYTGLLKLHDDVAAVPLGFSVSNMKSALHLPRDEKNSVDSIDEVHDSITPIVRGLHRGSLKKVYSVGARFACTLPRSKGSRVRNGHESTDFLIS